MAWRRALCARWQRSRSMALAYQRNGNGVSGWHRRLIGNISSNELMAWLVAVARLASAI